MSSVSDPLQQNLPPVAVARRVSVLRMLLSDVGACIALALVVLAVLGAAFAPWLSPTDPYGNDLANTLKPPGEFGLLGTDGQGRDMITRLLFGLRTTLLMGLASVVIGGLIGGVIGFAAAYYPRLSGLLMRLMDVLLSFPAILFGLAIAAIFGPGLPAVIIALAIATIPLMARVVRGSALVVLQQGYIEAARSLGLSHFRAMRYVVVPLAVRNIIPPLMNNCISLQKDTALVAIIGTIDAFNQSKIIAANNFNLSAVTTVAILFIVITIPQARFVDRLIERDRRRIRAGG